MKPRAAKALIAAARKLITAAYRINPGMVKSGPGTVAEARFIAAAGGNSQPWGVSIADLEVFKRQREQDRGR